MRQAPIARRDLRDFRSHVSIGSISVLEFCLGVAFRRDRCSIPSDKSLPNAPHPAHIQSFIPSARRTARANSLALSSAPSVTRSTAAGRLQKPHSLQRSSSSESRSSDRSVFRFISLIPERSSATPRQANPKRNCAIEAQDATGIAIELQRPYSGRVAMRF